MERTDQSFNIVDIKPDNMEELTEVITASSFHPQQCNLFMYSSSRGCIKLGDMRQRALCDEHSKMFEITEDTADRSFFSEIIASISDVKFAGDNGRYIVSRDYLTLKVSGVFGGEWFEGQNMFYSPLFSLLSFPFRFGTFTWNLDPSRPFPSTNICVQSCVIFTKTIVGR
jgi:hypothetical protein